MKKYLSVVFILTIFLSAELFSQTFYHGGRLGLSLGRADETTPKLGLQFGGLLESVTASNIAFETELKLAGEWICNYPDIL